MWSTHPSSQRSCACNLSPDKYEGPGSSNNSLNLARAVVLRQEVVHTANESGVVVPAATCRHQVPDTLGPGRNVDRRALLLAGSGGGGATAPLRRPGALFMNPRKWVRPASSMLIHSSIQQPHIRRTLVASGLNRGHTALAGGGPESALAEGTHASQRSAGQAGAVKGSGGGEHSRAGRRATREGTYERMGPGTSCGAGARAEQTQVGPDIGGCAVRVLAHAANHWRANAWHTSQQRAPWGPTRVRPEANPNPPSFFLQIQQVVIPQHQARRAAGVHGTAALGVISCAVVVLQVGQRRCLRFEHVDHCRVSDAGAHETRHNRSLWLRACGDGCSVGSGVMVVFVQKSRRVVSGACMALADGL